MAGERATVRARIEKKEQQKMKPVLRLQLFAPQLLLRVPAQQPLLHSLDSPIFRTGLPLPSCFERRPARGHTSRPDETGPRHSLVRQLDDSAAPPSCRSAERPGPFRSSRPVAVELSHHLGSQAGRVPLSQQNNCLFGVHPVRLQASPVWQRVFLPRFSRLEISFLP